MHVPARALTKFARLRLAALDARGQAALVGRIESFLSQAGALRLAPPAAPPADALADPAAALARLRPRIVALRAEGDRLAGLPTTPARARRLDALAASILELERAEETIIEAAELRGAPIARRPDASPLAILGVTAANP